jgi:hypothetical protein
MEAKSKITETADISTEQQRREKITVKTVMHGIISHTTRHVREPITGERMDWQVFPTTVSSFAFQLHYGTELILY